MDYLYYILISCLLFGFSIYGCVKGNIKVLENEIKYIKSELLKKPNLTDAEKEWLCIADDYIWKTGKYNKIVK